MKLIIAGTRTIKPSCSGISIAINHYNLDPTEIISGAAEGVDRSGEKYAKMKKLPVSLYHANWEMFGNYAGPKRNAEMAKDADALLLIWDGQSKGSANMKSVMKKLNKPVYEIIVKLKYDKSGKIISRSGEFK